jgi:hypothetical protein
MEHCNYYNLNKVMTADLFGVLCVSPIVGDANQFLFSRSIFNP